MGARAGSGFPKKLAIMFGAAVVAGFVVGFLLRPMLAPSSRIGELEQQLAESTKSADALKTRADGLDKQVADLTVEKKVLDGKLAEASKAQTELADQAKTADERAKALADAQAKLKATGAGTTTIQGDSLKLTMASGVLFKGNTDDLTDRGKQVLDKVAAVLNKELADKKIDVEGHTDETPPQPPAPPKTAATKTAPTKTAAKTPPPKKGSKPAAPTKPAAPATPAAPVERLTSWELSGSRAVTVVRYLQDKKVDPTRLEAIAGGPFHPISKTNKALNRRIDLVLTPKPAKK
ncbi:MAG TPA: hypothetical protein VFQ53_43115 [Kofleriaceae bacterium]|nr:hypothetical protein [Kofleriaceae bacterium]